MAGRGLYGVTGIGSASFATALRLTAACALALIAAACSAEKREVGPAPPLTPPTGLSDSRQKLYETNRFEQAEGARLFRWAGCDACHTENAAGGANLSDNQWKHGAATAQIYATIASGAPEMPAYQTQFTPQQLWQISGYVKTLHKTKPEMRRRNAAAQQGEPSGANWSGALR